MNDYYDSKGRYVSLTKRLAKSGEGEVWQTDCNGYLGKIYHSPNLERAKKLQVMMVNPPEDPTKKQNHISIAWVQDLLMNSSGSCVGFLMPPISQAKELTHVYNPKCRQRDAQGFNWYYLHAAAYNVALIVGALHTKGYVIGDMKPQNLLVNDQGLVSIIDTDSFQVIDPKLGTVYHCPVCTPDYDPPELLNKKPSSVTQTTHHDNFRLAVIIFHLLFGYHPFGGKWTGPGDGPQTIELIRQGLWLHGQSRNLQLTDKEIPLNVVHPEIQKLFLKCFNDGHTSPYSRPTPQDWYNALRIAIDQLTHCSTVSNHFYNQSNANCYWCERKKKLGVDIFSAPFSLNLSLVKNKFLLNTNTTIKPQIIPNQLPNFNTNNPVPPFIANQPLNSNNNSVPPLIANQPLNSNNNSVPPQTIPNQSLNSNNNSVPPQIIPNQSPSSNNIIHSRAAHINNQPNLKKYILYLSIGIAFISLIITIGALITSVLMYGKEKIQSFQNAELAKQKQIQDTQKQRLANVQVLLSTKRCPSCDLQDVNLQGADLRQANLNGANLLGANLSNSSLLGATLVSANLQDSKLKNANLTSANLSNAKLENAELNGARAEKANFSGANLTKAVLEDVKANAANFVGAKLLSTSLKTVQMQMVNMQGANLKKADMFRGDFREANFERANLEETSQWFSNFEGATMPNGEKQSVNKSQSDNSGVPPEKIVQSYYSNLNNRQYSAAWKHLSNQLQTDTKVHEKGYQSFLQWWGSVDKIEIQEVSLVSKSNEAAIVDTDLKYSRGSSVVPESLRLSLIRDTKTDSWVINRADRK